MTKYDASRPPVKTELRRAVEVESGHACAVSRCGEHTYLELHHINENREDNRVENLVLLCDKHHKMAHAGVIDRKALQEYKRLLRDAYSSALVERVQKLEELMQQGQSIQAEGSVPEPIAATQDPGLPIKTTVKRWEVSYQTLEELAISRFERQNNLLLERRPRFTRGNARLQLDAIRQDDDLAEDIIVEVRWLRKRYLDGPIWVRQVEAATSTYELISGRKARGVLIFVVPKEDMKNISDLPWTSEELPKLVTRPEVVIYTYDELGFVPGAISSDLFATNIKPPPRAA